MCLRLDFYGSHVCCRTSNFEVKFEVRERWPVVYPPVSYCFIAEYGADVVFNVKLNETATFHPQNPTNSMTFHIYHRWWQILRSENASIIQVRSSKERSVRLPAIRIRCDGRIVACRLGCGNIDVHERPLSARRFIGVRPVTGQSDNVNGLHRRSSIPTEQFLERSMAITMARHISAG